MNFFKKRKKIFLLITLLLFLVLFFSLIITASNVVRYGYDKQSKVIELIRDIIPSHYIKKIKENLFYISNLKSRNDFLETQIKKYEQGNKGKKFKTNIIELEDEAYEVNYFFLPFKRLDTNLGWNAEENSLRAHYSEIYNENFFSISGEGKTVFFNKNNLLKNELQFQDLPNNINDILKENNSKLIGIRDLYFYENQILISMMIEDHNGITINLYKANLNFEKIYFQLFFQTGEFWKNYNVFSGGRIEKFKDDKILFSTGFANNLSASQNKNSLLGKIIVIDLNSNKHELMSYGHRNPQGLYYHKNENLIINTEHGPKGGDEINFNFLESNQEKNFGWPRVSYGQAYPGQEKLFENDTFEKSHEELGFIEPFKYFTPSIGISEILSFNKNSFCKSNCLWVSSLRANSIYILDLDETFKKLVKTKRIFLKGNRIRDIDFDEDLDLVILLSENIPSIITLKKVK